MGLDPKEAESQLEKMLGPMKESLKKAEKLLEQLPSLGPKEKKTIVVNGVEAGLSITNTGMLIIEMPDKAQAEQFYKETSSLSNG